MAAKDVRFETLGQRVCALVPEGARKILLYVEFVDEGVVSPALFYELAGGELHYIASDHLISEELFLMQDRFGPEVRAMEFELEGARFSTRLAYADTLEVGADTETRTDAVLQRCFGHASAHYQQL